ncbi:MAG: SDR family oxidoreductase [Candidatus Harrisonbacteria bacterium]|nr:SDR family oxidoreductase [Candidatus Harrisonbacteria bacterium]
MAKQKTILVTGGAGFIGSSLCERLLASGARVICLDNLFTGSEKNIAHLRLPAGRHGANPNFVFVKHDIITPFYSAEHIDAIYNLACPASPIHYQSNAIRTIKANTIGMINVLGLAKKHGARILQASTSEVYGDPLEHPQKESYRGNVNPIGPRACYDEGKRVAETLCFDYHRAHGLEIRVARIFNTYGPRMAANDGRVVSNFITQALRGDDITMYGDGTQTRSFCYVDDLVEGLIRLMNLAPLEARAKGAAVASGDLPLTGFTGPVNLGNPKEFTVLQLAKKVIAMTKSASKIVTKSLPEDDPRKRKPDITLAKKVLRWEPKVKLEEGLAKTIAYFAIEAERRG